MQRKFRPIYTARISPDMAFKIDCRTYVGESSYVFLFGVDIQSPWNCFWDLSFVMRIMENYRGDALLLRATGVPRVSSYTTAVMVVLNVTANFPPFTVS
jgi:hypothetical protein